jgi:hypothetical protein
LPTLSRDSAEAQRIDTALQNWRQGDLVLGEQWFVHVGNPLQALTPAADEAGGTEILALPSEVPGLVVVTQTCDVVRACVDRPYVEVSPLVQLQAEELVNVERGRRPNLAALPALATGTLVVDLDRVMTVEKSIVASWHRTPGHVSDAEARAFAQALARKRARFAFPDDFTELVKKLHQRLGEKHGKSTDEGRGLRALREIRVQASPNWEATPVELFFWFVRTEADVTFEGKSWADLLALWLQLVRPSNRFASVEGQVVSLEDLSALEYVTSDLLDLDHLSMGLR